MTPRRRLPLVPSEHMSVGGHHGQQESSGMILRTREAKTGTLTWRKARKCMMRHGLDTFRRINCNLFQLVPRAAPTNNTLRILKNMSPTSKATKSVHQRSLAVSQPDQENCISATNVLGLQRNKSRSEKTERTYVLCSLAYDARLTQS